MNALIEDMAAAIWSARQETYRRLGLTPLADWRDEQDVARDAVRREAESAAQVVSRRIFGK